MKLQRFALVILSFVAGAAFAQNTSTTSLSGFGNTADHPRGLWLFAGGNGAIINTDIDDGFANGDLGGLRALGSYYNPEMIYNFGATLDAVHLQDKNIVNLGAIDLAARYRLDDRWNAGVDVLTYVNVGENLLGGNQYLSPFVGLGFGRDITGGDNLIRLGGRLLTDTTVARATMTLAQVTLEVGFGATPARSVSSATSVEPVPVQEELTLNDAPAAPAEPVKVTVMNFDVSSTKIGRANQVKLQKLSRILENNKHLFTRVEIIGHADKTGTDKINNPLSKNRALSVAEVMKKGAPQVSERIVGMGSRVPVSQELAPNRRVEVIIRGVKDEALLNQAIKSIE